MIKFAKIALILGLISTSLLSQTQLDARGLGLCDTYTTASRGYGSVGVNPANLGFDSGHRFEMNLASADLSAFNNFLSLYWFNTFFTGDPLTRHRANPDPINFESIVPGETYSYKELFLQLVPNNGFSFGFSTYIPHPILNFSWDNYAITSGLEIYERTTIPKGILEIALEGNPIDSTYGLSFGQDIIIIDNVSFSFAIPFKDFSIGITTKYLAGLGYAGVDSSGGQLTTSAEGLVADGFYRYTRAIGGNGLGIDVGITTNPIGKWRFSLAVNNLIGRVYFGKENYLTAGIDAIEQIVPVRSMIQIPEEDGQFTAQTLYTFNIDSLNALKFFSNDIDSLIYSNEENLGTFDSLSINYPAVFRMGASYAIHPEMDMYMDLSAGFDDYYYAVQQWRFATGLEMTRFKRFRLRTGLAWGGRYGKEMGFGLGFVLPLIKIDFGLRLLGGYSLQNAEGIEIGLNSSIHF